jgi:hypothetical protein
VTLRRGAVTAPVDVEIDVRGTRSPHAAPGRIEWEATATGTRGSASGPGWTAVLSLVPADGALSLDVELRYDEPTTPAQESVRLTLPGTARAVGRDLRFASLDGLLRVDRGTPVVVATDRVAVVGGEGVVAARYVPARGRTVVELILDDEAAHPFSVYERCQDRLPASAEWGRLERRRPLTGLSRAAGARVRAHATLHLLDPGVRALPVIVERWAGGAQGMLVVTDHADRTDPRALRAVLFGTSERTDRGYGRRGLFGHGLTLTKSFFARGGRGTLADDPDARALADEIVAHGGEVASHSITPAADVRDAVRAGLATFDPWNAVTWIDHEPYTNCEALSSRGTEAGGPYEIADLLADHGYRWVWAATDLPGADHDLFGGPPASPRAAIFPLPPDPRLWVFRSAWFYEPPETLAAMLDARALTSLASRRGLLVAHTYLSASAATTNLPDHRRRLAVRPAAGGRLEIAPALDAALARVATRVADGSLAVSTWRDAGDRLLALGRIEVEYRADGSAIVVNRGATALSGLTLALPAPGLRVLVDGAEVAGERADEDRSTVWFPLAAGARAVVRAERAGAPVPLLPGGPVAVEPR